MRCSPSSASTARIRDEDKIDLGVGVYRTDDGERRLRRGQGAAVQQLGRLNRTARSPYSSAPKATRVFQCADCRMIFGGDPTMGGRIAGYGGVGGARGTPGAAPARCGSRWRWRRRPGAPLVLHGRAELAQIMPRSLSIWGLEIVPFDHANP